MAIVRRSMVEMLSDDDAARSETSSVRSSGDGGGDGVGPTEPRVIMGIDPGTVVLGYAVVELRGIDNVRVLVTGVIKLSKFESHYERLARIYQRISALVTQYKPVEMALEAPFYGENVQSMLKLGRAQGVAMAAAFAHDLPVFEYAPRRVKQAITGRGAASKEQVAAMLDNILDVGQRPKELDAMDALAVAVCHSFSKVNR